MAAPRHYYNEWDSYAAQWLRNLIAKGLIPEGDVDERSIADVSADDLIGYTQCHFFAGIGGWPLALAIAGWPAERGVWTGSCPCQPFSAAGKRRGVDDERHLWPVWSPLIAKRRPAVVFGEQVASKDGRIWLSGVRTDLEAMGRRVGAADLCSAGVGSPNIRQRLYWVANNNGQGCSLLEERDCGAPAGDEVQQWLDANGRSRTGRMADPGTSGRRALQRSAGTNGRSTIEPDGYGDVGGLGSPSPEGLEGSDARALGQQFPAAERAGSVLGFWSAFDLLHCTDGKARRIEPGAFPLAHGVPNRVGRLRAYGNAINPWVAAEFVRAYLDATGCDDGVTLEQLAT